MAFSSGFEKQAFVAPLIGGIVRAGAGLAGAVARPATALLRKGVPALARGVSRVTRPVTSAAKSATGKAIAGGIELQGGILPTIFNVQQGVSDTSSAYKKQMEAMHR